MRNLRDDVVDLDAEWEAQCERRHAALLRRYPDCRDPGHPGCDDCRSEEVESEAV